MTGPRPARQGHTRIAPAALRHTIEAVAAGAFGVRRGDVSATLADDAAKLGVDLSVRLPPPPLLGTAGRGRQSAFERASIARLKISSLGQQITGLDCGRISIRIAGAGRSTPEPRVDAKQDRRKP